MQPMQPTAPGKKGLWIGVMLIVIGVVGGIALIVVGAKSAADTVNSYQRVDGRTGGTVTFSKAGRYDAYFERPGIRRRSDIPSIHVVLSGPGGQQTLDSDITRTNTTEHYTFGDHDGVRLTQFNVSQPGPYEVRLVVAGEPVGGSVGDIAFGRGSITAGLLSVVGGVLGGGLVAFIGVIVLITSAVRRGRYRTRMAQAGYGSGYGGPWPPAGPVGPTTMWPPPAAQPGPPGPPARPGQPPGWAPPPSQQPVPQPAWPPAAPPRGSGPPNDPNRPGWGGPGQ